MYTEIANTVLKRNCPNVIVDIVDRLKNLSHTDTCLLFPWQTLAIFKVVSYTEYTQFST